MLLRGSPTKVTCTDVVWFSITLVGVIFIVACSVYAFFFSVEGLLWLVH
jgi:hypothetical protein